MTTARRWIAALLGLTLAAPIQAQGVDSPALLVVYGASAPAREGDTDRREQVFISLPADLRDRVYLRLYDPETFGDNDFTYGGPRDSVTTYRVFGGEGAFSAADRPAPVADGATEPRLTPVTPITGPGKLLRESAWGADDRTDGRWVTLTALRAAQGEVIGDRAYFRLDVQGSQGNDGNGFTLGLSLSRDGARPVPDAHMFAYRSTVRWARQNPPTQVWFHKEAPGPLTVQSFDGANGELALVTEFADLGLRISGQSHWTSDVVDTDERDLALSLLGGFETPNDVTLAVFDDQGAPLPLTMPPRRALQPARPTAVGTARPLADCRAVAFDASGTQGRAPLRYVWEFGDGQTARDPVIVHRYDGPGRYEARLQVVEPGNGPGRGAQITVPVHVRNAPLAMPGDDIIVAPGQAVAFDGGLSRASDSPITRYQWQFGDGGGANGVTASHVYATPGQYRAVLRVGDDSRHPCNFGVATRVVTVNTPPVAEAGTDQTAEVGQVVTLNGAASYDVDGQVADYSWDMGDGTVLNGATVSHSYDRSGVFPVVLSVRDNSGVANDLARDQLRISVNNPPVPAFDMPDRPLSVAEVGLFDASGSSDSDGQILSYLWAFGDGITGEGAVVNYAWTQPGTYPVTLTVTDDSGTASARRSLTRQVRVDAAPMAKAGPDQYVTASEVLFDGSASTDPDGQVTDWQWEFGDGATGQGAQVSHAYQRPGTYEVALTVRDDSGAPLNTHRDTMQVVVNASPIADAGPAQTVAPGALFTLSGRGSVDPDGQIIDYLWRLPDGSQASGQRISHMLMRPGLYRVGLLVADDFPGGAATDQGEVLITVNAPPVAVAGADHLIAPGDTVTFDAGQSFDPDGQLSAFRWEFDDLGTPLQAAQVQRAYPAPGVWSAQLIVTDDSGVLNGTASDDVTIRVNHPPVAEAGDPITTDSLFVTLDASGSADADGDALMYTWDFGDGSTGQGAQVTHAFSRAGIYPVTLRVDDGTGLSNAQAVDATTVTIQTRPVADAGGNREVCSGEPILFDASGSVDPDGGLLLYDWDFGDGSVSDLINPTKTYERPGVYPVTLQVRDETGTAHGSDMDRIAALVREGPIADAGPDLTVCANQDLRFDGSGSTDADGAVNAFAWTFGDGATASGERPAHSFARPGSYTVTLTITGDAQGSCSPLDSDTTQITVLPAPGLTIDGPDRMAAGARLPFAALLSDADTGQIASVTWEFGDGTTAQGPDVTHSYALPGSYLITLRASLNGAATGCSELVTQRKVIVNAAPDPIIEGPDIVALGQEVTFDAAMSSDSDGAILGYLWDFGDGATGQGVATRHRYDAPGRYDLRLTVVDDAGVGNSQVSIRKTITVPPAPTPQIVAQGAVCPGDPVTFALADPGAGAVAWQIGDGALTPGETLTHSFDSPGVMPVRVRADDGGDLATSRRFAEIYQRINHRPTALAGPDRVVCPGDEVTFDARASGDLDGALTAWSWVFSDGVTLEGPVVSRRFDSPGDLRVRLTVRDDSGAAGCDLGTDDARILVNAPPSVDAGPDQSLPVGAAHDLVRFDASGAQDPDGHGLRIGWDFGDGATASGAVTRHSYAQPGQYTVTVTARDSTGLSCGVAQDTAVITATER